MRDASGGPRRRPGTPRIRDAGAQGGRGAECCRTCRLLNPGLSADPVGSVGWFRKTRVRALQQPLAAAVFLLVGACAAEPPVASLRDGGDGSFRFASADIYDFADVVTGQAQPRLIAGRLRLPEGPVRGAVVLSHGSGGAGDRQRQMAEWLAERGWASLVVDHFGPRGVGSTIRDQLAVSEQSMAVDVFAAKALLETHPAIPPGRIGVIGWSKGGTTALLAAVERLAEYAVAAAPDAEPEDRLAFAVAYYPFCGMDLGDETLGSPLLMLLGSADDWTPPEPCEALARTWSDRGELVSVETYTGALHGFDSSGTEVRRISEAITVRDTSPACTLRVGEDGAARTVDGRLSVTTPQSRAAFLRECGERGVTFGGDPSARERSFRALEAFLEELG